MQLHTSPTSPCFGGNQSWSHSQNHCIVSPQLWMDVMLLDRTPCTWTMTSHSICSKDSCDPWYTHLNKYYPVSAQLFHLDCSHPSQPPADKSYPWLSSTDLTT